MAKYSNSKAKNSNYTKRKWGVSLLDTVNFFFLILLFLTYSLPLPQWQHLSLYLLQWLKKRHHLANFFSPNHIWRSTCIKIFPGYQNSKCQHSIQEILEHMTNCSMEESSSPRRVSHKHLGQKPITHPAPGWLSQWSQTLDFSSSHDVRIVS